MSGRRRSLLLAIALAAAVLALAGPRLLGGWDRGSAAPQAGAAASVPVERTVVETASERDARLAQLDGSLRAIHDGDSLAPRDRWDPAYMVESVGRNADSLFAWVRDSTTWIPYLGRLRGPVGVLMDRQGNDLDRALLLADLLRRAGDSVRLARGRLPRERAVELLPELVTGALTSDSMTAQSAIPGSESLHTTAAKYRLDGDAVAGGLAAQIQAASRFHDDLVARATEQGRRLEAQVGAEGAAAEWQTRYQAALEALEDHWWVQRREGGRWIDLDPLASPDSSGTALTPATETMAATSVPAELEHEITVRVVGEQWSGGRLSEHVALEGTLRPADLIGQAIVLQGWPAQWPTQLHPDPASKFGLRGAALDQHAWGLALLAGDSAVAQGVLYDDGSEHPSHGGGGLGGLGAGIGAIARSPAAAPGPASELTAAWIEFELRDPGLPKRLIRRAVFDLVGPATRKVAAPSTLAVDDSTRLVRSLSLMIRTELLPVTARLAPDYLTHLTARGIVANGRVLRTMAAADNAHAPDPDTLIAQAAPPASPLYSLAAARLEWSPVGDRTFVDRLGLLTSHRHPAAFGGGFGVRGAIEVVAGGLGVPLTEGDAVAIRLRQGVFDTNAEAFWWPGEHLLNTGEAYQGAQDWMALTAERRSQIGSLRLSPDAQARIALDLDSGLVIVTPTAPTGPEHYVGWWRVDPRTGETHGVVGTGWGMCQEYASLLESALIRAAADFEFEYAMCQGLEQGINAVKAGVADAQARGFLRGLGPVEYQSAKKVFKENDRNCVFVAITAGVFSTLPIILKVGQAMRMQRIAARRTAFLAEREGLRKELEALAKRMGPPRPPGPKPRSLREAEQAFRKAMEYYNDAASKYADFVKSGNGSLNDFRALRAALDDAKGLVNETGNTMTAARREAARMADANRVRKSAPTLPELEKELAEVDKKIADFDRTIPDFNRDFAESLLQIGFGGVLTGK